LNKVYEMSLDLGSCKNVKIQTFKDNETCCKKKKEKKALETFKTLKQIQ